MTGAPAFGWQVNDARRAPCSSVTSYSSRQYRRSTRSTSMSSGEAARCTPRCSRMSRRTASTSSRTARIGGRSARGTPKATRAPTRHRRASTPASPTATGTRRGFGTRGSRRTPSSLFRSPGRSSASVGVRSCGHGRMRRPGSNTSCRSTAHASRTVRRSHIPTSSTTRRPTFGMHCAPANGTRSRSSPTGRLRDRATRVRTGRHRPYHGGPCGRHARGHRDRRHLARPCGAVDAGAPAQ